MKAYKCVLAGEYPDGTVKLVSCATSSYGGQIEYKEGEWVTPLPDNGPLAVFDTWQNANTFIVGFTDIFDEYKIYECEYEPSIFTELWEVTDCGVRRMVTRFPKGTLFASKVKLIKGSVVPWRKENE